MKRFDKKISAAHNVLSPSASSLTDNDCDPEECDAGACSCDNRSDAKEACEVDALIANKAPCCRNVRPTKSGRLKGQSIEKSTSPRDSIASVTVNDETSQDPSRHSSSSPTSATSPLIARSLSSKSVQTIFTCSDSNSEHLSHPPSPGQDNSPTNSTHSTNAGNSVSAKPKIASSAQTSHQPMLCELISTNQVAESEHVLHDSNHFVRDRNNEDSVGVVCIRNPTFLPHSCPCCQSSGCRNAAENTCAHANCVNGGSPYRGGCSGNSHSCGSSVHYSVSNSNANPQAAVNATPSRTFASCNDQRRPSLQASVHSLASSVCTSTLDFCRICHCEANAEQPLISPCYCSGTLRWVHQKCLQQWIKSSQTRACEVCRFCFIMESRVKPLRKWEKLDMTSVERRKILCSVTFHVIAITCVVWSLYVLIDRTAEEIRGGHLDWPFWTKLVVVAIGFTGGLVFMYVQCKMYLQLFRRWKAYNKVIFVQNCPDQMKQSAKLACRASLIDET